MGRIPKDDIPYMKWTIKVMFETTNAHQSWEIHGFLPPLIS